MQHVSLQCEENTHKLLLYVPGANHRFNIKHPLVTGYEQNRGKNTFF